MSIRPEFARAILSRDKRVEFRKRRLAPDVSRVVIYTTSPVRAVVGEFSVAEQVVTSPHALWRRFREVAGIDRRSFFEYFDGQTYAVGIMIDSVVEYESPVPLANFAPGTRPPQSFMYLAAEGAT